MAAAAAQQSPRPQPPEDTCPPSPGPQPDSKDKSVADRGLSASAVSLAPPSRRANTPAVGKHVNTKTVALAVVEAPAAGPTQQSHAPSHASLPSAVAPRLVSSVDVAAFAAQAAAVAHAEHTAAILRRKQAAAAMAAASEKRNSAGERKRRSDRPARGGGGSSVPDKSNSAKRPATKSPSRKGAASKGGGGAGAAYCLIPQPYHKCGGNQGSSDPRSSRDHASYANGARSSSFTGSFEAKSNTGGGSECDGVSCRSEDGDAKGGAVPGQTREALRKRRAAGVFQLNEGSDSDGRYSGDQNMSAECRLERSREQNRQSSRKARLRRKSEETSLKDQIASIQIFRLMVEEGPDMMSIHGLDHRAPFRYASSAFQRVAGINPRDVLGRSLTDLIVPEDHGIVQQALLKVVFSHIGDHIVSYRMITPHRKTMMVETSIRTGDQCIICVARVVQQHSRRDNIGSYSIKQGNCSYQGGYHKRNEGGARASNGTEGTAVHVRSSDGAGRTRTSSSERGREDGGRGDHSDVESSDADSDGDEECS